MRPSPRPAPNTGQIGRASRLGPASAGTSRPGVGAASRRAGRFGLAAILAASAMSLACATAPAATASAAAPLSARTADPLGDHTVAAPTYNKRGQQTNATDWDPALADISDAGYAQDYGASRGEANQHQFIVSTDMAWRTDADSYSGGKRTTQTFDAEVWVDGSKMVTFRLANGLAPDGQFAIEWEDPSDAPYQRSDCFPSGLGSPDDGTMTFLWPFTCLPSSASTITKVVYRSNVWAVNAKNKGRLVSRDTATLNLSVPARP